jgi:ParB family chromosome partitioning protein
MDTKIKEFKGILSPIFNEDATEQTALNNPKIQNLIKSIPIQDIQPKENQPRKIFDAITLDELTESIISMGVIQPIIVRQLNEKKYEIIVGERRWRAAKQAGLDKIPAIIKEYDQREAAAVALIENIQREDLNPLEEAQALQSLLEDYSMTHSQVAESIGRSRAAVSNILRLLNLEDGVKEMLNSKLLEIGHAKVLLSLSGDQQIAAAIWVVENACSVRETEKIVKRFKSPSENQETTRPLEFQQKAQLWEEHLFKRLSLKINIKFNESGKGKFIIPFNSIEEAEELAYHLELSKLR